MNGHIGKDSGSFERVHGGQGYGVRNKSGYAILNFERAYDLISTLGSRRIHTFIFKSGTKVSNIDFILTQKVDSRCHKDCKVITRESVTTQHM